MVREYIQLVYCLEEGESFYLDSEEYAVYILEGL